MVELSPPPVAFLGVCDRANFREYGQDNLHDLIGLRKIVATNFYPLPLRSCVFVFAIYTQSSSSEILVRLMDPDGKEVTHIRVTMGMIKEKEESEGVELQPAGTAVLRTLEFPGKPQWLLIQCGLAEPGPMILKSGVYDVILEIAGERKTIGWLAFTLNKFPPLTPDRIAALRTNPMAPKNANFELGCRQCKDELKCYVAFEKSKEFESKGMIWYSDLPAFFECKCGKTKVDLESLRLNFHSVLLSTVAQNELSLIRLYERGVLEKTCLDFGALLDSNPPEEKVQVFLKRNSILLQTFTPERVFYKAPILTKYKCDIAIVTQRRSLLLIEIEKPSTRLLTKQGGIASELQHAIDQIQDWLHEVKNHRNAFLDSLDLKMDDINSIRGIVIAGRDGMNASRDLMKLKGRDFGEFDLLTYDDLLRSATGLFRQVSNL